MNNSVPTYMEGRYLHLNNAKTDAELLVSLFEKNIRTIAILNSEDNAIVAMWDGDWG